MTNIIDDQFIETWRPQYDKIENYESEYIGLLKKVSLEMKADRSLTKQTFCEILNWFKSARVKGRINWVNFETYSNTIRECYEASGMEKMEKVKLLDDLPGIGAPIASTFLHFLCPKSFPIFSRSTVNVLSSFGYNIQPNSTGIAQYKAFMETFLEIKDCCPKWSLRDIDRAVFAYHKLST